MPLWGNTDVAGNSAIFAPAQVKQAPDATNRNALYGNTTANAYFGSGETIGQYGVSGDEMRAVRAGGFPRPSGPGWVLRTTGSGGRGGRVQNELLVAMHVGAEGGGGEDLAFPDFGIVYTINPSDTTGNASNNQIAKFNSNAHNVPAGGSLTYKWQKWGGSAFANVDNAGAYSNTTTKQLSVLANTVVANGEVYRVGGYQSGAITTYSGNATLTLLPLITMDTQPVDAQGDASNDDVVNFFIIAAADPITATLHVQWQKWGGSAFANLTNGSGYSDVTTATLSVNANTVANGEIYRAMVLSDDNDAINVFTSNAILTVVA